MQDRGEVFEHVVNIVKHRVIDIVIRSIAAVDSAKRVRV
jgi:hypothetical protein